jgi:hypothetical protein
MEYGRPARLAERNRRVPYPRLKKTQEECEILDDRCITFGAILQPVAWLWFKESLIQPIQRFIEVAEAAIS